MSADQADVAPEPYPSRVRVRYSSDDAQPVQLAGVMEASTSTVVPGDVIEVAGFAAQAMLARNEDGEPMDPRWERVDDDEPLTDRGPLADVDTVEKLKSYLDDAGVDYPAKAHKDDLTALAEAHAAANPQPLGADESAVLPPEQFDHGGTIPPDVQLPSVPNGSEPDESGDTE